MADKDPTKADPEGTDLINQLVPDPSNPDVNVLTGVFLEEGRTTRRFAFTPPCD